MAARYCAVCRKLLPTDMRKDALYCSNNCRVRASYFRRKQEEESEQPQTKAPYIERARPLSGPEQLLQGWEEYQARTTVYLLPVEDIRRPHSFLEAHPEVWLERSILSDAPRCSTAYRLVKSAESSPRSAPAIALTTQATTEAADATEAEDVSFSLSPFEPPTVAAPGTYRIEYLDPSGQVLVAMAERSLRFDEVRR